MHRLDDAQRADLFRSFFDNAPIGMAVTATDGTWLGANAALAEMLGYANEELLATTMLALTHPDDQGETREGIRSLVAQECASWTFEKRVRAKDSAYLWVHITTRLQQALPGVPALLFNYVLDITKRKNADVLLRSSEEQYRRLFESAKDGILILDAATGCVVDANPFMGELTGYPLEYFLGKHLWEIGPFRDLAASKLSFAELQARDYVRYEDLPLKALGGGVIDVEFVSNVYVVNSKKVIQCNVRDISVRKRAEAALRLRDRAIEAASQGIVITDSTRPDNPITYANPGFSRLTGYQTSEILGRNCRFLQGPGSDAAAVSMFRDAIKNEKACVADVLNYRKDGTTFWNNLALTPVKDAAGAVTNYVGVQTDISGRKKLESQLLQAQKMEAVGRLAGGIAHDFNNLLSVILSYADMTLNELTPGEPIRADIEEIKKAGQRATQMTRQLLAFSRQQVLETKVLNLSQVVGGMEKMLARLLGADIETTLLPAATLGSVKADPGQVEQIIMNLAVNARDAMPQGGKLTIETANVELDEEYARTHHDVKSGAYVLLAVSDTGTGMSKDTMAKIFEPYFTTKEHGKGTGLGLATVFGIVKQSGGHISVYTEEGKGSTFKVYFPRLGAGVVDAAAPWAPAFEAETERATGTILLVEDEEQVRVLARGILRRQGYVVLDVPNGGEALLACEQHGGTIDLLLTDVVLPRMSGRQLAQRVEHLRPAMKVMYMSGYTDDTVLHHGILDSGVAFLQKPFTPASLVRKVQEVMLHPQTKRQRG